MYFVVDFVNQNETEIFIYFWKNLLETVSFRKEIFSSNSGNIYYSHICGEFNCKLFMTIYLFCFFHLELTKKLGLRMSK